MIIKKKRILQVNKGDCTGDYNWYDTCYYEILGETEMPDGYLVFLNDEWQPLTEDIPLPQDVTGRAYESFSNYHVDNERAKMRIIFKNCPEFKLYYRSDAEPGYDYVMVSKIDTEIPSDATYSSSSVAANTRTYQNTWRNITFSNDGNEHFIEVVYRKDNSNNTDPDKGFVFIENKFLPENY